MGPLFSGYHCRKMELRNSFRLDMVNLDLLKGEGYRKGNWKLKGDGRWGATEGEGGGEYSKVN